MPDLKQICVISQPTFMPWIGWFDLVDQADILIILDDVQFSKQSWQQRNRLPSANGLVLLTVPVQSSGRSKQLISEVELAKGPVIEKLLRSIQGYCARAPYFKDYFPALREITLRGAESGRLLDLNIAIIDWVINIFGIRVQIVRSSTLKASGKRGGYVAALCDEVEAIGYLSPAGAEEYLIKDFQSFKERGIKVQLHQFEHPKYKQCFEPFSPFASVLDLIFNTGPEALNILRSGRRPARTL